MIAQHGLALCVYTHDLDHTDVTHRLGAACCVPEVGRQQCIPRRIEAMSPSPGRHAVTLLASGQFRAVYGAYVALLQSLVLLAVALSLVVSIDRVLKVARHALILLHCAWTRRRPEQRFSARPLPDAAVYAALYPSVAVQLPMFNEAAVCQAIIDSVCELAWPRARFCVQVRLLEVQGWCDA